MRKILAILLVALMVLSFVPLRNTKTVVAASNTKATMILNTLHEIIPLVRDPLNANPANQDFDRFDYTLNFEPVYWDTNLDGSVDAGDTFLAGNRPPVQANPNNVTLIAFPQLNYIGYIDVAPVGWSTGDALYYNYGDNINVVDEADILIAGTPYPKGTAYTFRSDLNNLPANLTFVDVDLNNFWGPYPLRRFDLKLGNASFPWMPLQTNNPNNVPDLLWPTTNVTQNEYGNDYAKIFATDMFLTVESTGGLSSLSDRYYVIAEEGKELWFDVPNSTPGVFDQDDMIVLDIFSTGRAATIDVGDIILYSRVLPTPYIVQPASTFRRPNDGQSVNLVGQPLNIMPVDIYHTDNIVANGQYDPGEWIYQNVADPPYGASGWSPVVNGNWVLGPGGDIRLTPVYIDGHFYPVNSVVTEPGPGQVGNLDPNDDLDVEMPLVSFRDTETMPRHARWFFIDPDTFFNVTQPKDTDPLNNTMGPFSLGSTVRITQGTAKGRVFQIGWIDWATEEEEQVPEDNNKFVPMGINKNIKPMVNGDVVKGKVANAPPQELDSGDIFLFFEVLTASCCGYEKVYDISVESDVEPVLWPNPLTNNPLANAILGPGTGKDFSPMTKELARSTAFGVSTTTFFNIKLTNREYLDLEIFRDDGVNVYGDLPTTKDDQNDNFSFGPGAGAQSFGEEFLGNHTFPFLSFWSTPIPSPFGAQVPYNVIPFAFLLNPIGANVLYADYGTSKVRYIDLDVDGAVSTGDIRIDPYLFFPAWSIVGPNDQDVPFGNAPVYTLIPYALIDYNHNNFYEWYQEVDWDGFWTPTVDKYPGPELKDIVPLWPTTNVAVRSVVRGIDMYHGDWKAMDIQVVPGKFDLDVTINIDEDTTTDKLKVEQTYTVTVKVDPNCLGPNDKVLVTIELPGYDTNGIEGFELIADPLTLTKNNPEGKWHNVTPWRGNQNKDLKNYTDPGFRITGYLLRGEEVIGPFDTSDKNGLKIIESPFSPKLGIFRAVIPEAENVYDCLSVKKYNIEPENLKAIPSEECLSFLDQRFPNISFTITNVNNTTDVDDPTGLITQQEGNRIFAYINAKGGGISYLAVAARGKSRYVLQVNNDGTVTYWPWPGDILLSGPPVPIGTALSVDPNIKFVDSNGNGSWDAGEPIYRDTTVPLTYPNGNNIVDLDDILLYGNKAALGSLLVADQNLRVADNPLITGNVYGPRTANVWDYGDAVYYSINNLVDVDNDNVYDFGDTGTNSYVTVSGGTLNDLNENLLPDINESVSATGGAFFILAYPFASRIETDGDIWALIHPVVKECDDIFFDIFTTHIMYNFLGPRPPNYLLEEDRYPLNDVNPLYANGLPGPNALDHGLVDYKADPQPKVRTEKIYDLNFAEFEIVDEGLRHSIFANPYPPYGPKANQDPWVLKNLEMEIRSYPGGQTNLPGSGWGYDYRKLPNIGPQTANQVVGLTNGWNARHAQIRTMFWKLGTEYYPLTDYTIRFVAKLKDGTHVKPDLVIINGKPQSPEGQPVFMVGPYDGNYTYEPTGTPNLPKTYKYFNKFTVSSFSSTLLDKPGGYNLDFTFEDGWTLSKTTIIKGIIPTGPGYITITMYYGDYEVTYKYCTSCMDSSPELPVHGIELVPNTKQLFVDENNDLTVKSKIYSRNNVRAGENTAPIQPLANNILIYVWQDRGILDPNRPQTGVRYGVGDGWVTGQTPRFGGSPIDTLSGTLYNAGPVYNAIDRNGDGLIRFSDYETEIVGTYITALNVWNGGFVYLSSLTTPVTDGEYKFDLTSENGALLDEIGFDFDENGIILSNEVIPVRITAYSYGDDGVNPRVYTTTGGNGWEPWEVYLAGHVELPVVGREKYNIDYEPCLTAGVLPEAQPDGKPLTFMITDADGNPVDLSIGVGGKEVNDTLIWYGLFNDVVPSVLPTFYWVRTDLHNKMTFTDPDTGITHALPEHLRAANDMYNSSFAPIKINFDEKDQGKYVFEGFVANDKGEFEVIVMSPDRKLYGKKTVKVELPKIKYEIVNLDDASGTVHTVPGDPDFVMTAGDLRTYKVTVTVTDCEDKPISGLGKPVDECGPEPSGVYAGFLPYVAYTPHYFLWLGYDENEDTDIFGDEWDAFDVYANTWNFSADEMSAPVGNYIRPPHKPTLTAYRYGYGDYDAAGNFHGLDQAIFNSEYNYDKWEWGQLYPDRNKDCVIDVDDTLPLDENGQVTFYIETDDISVLSGIVGKNPYVLTSTFADVAGWPANMNYARTRFGPASADWGFYLDWYGNVDKTVDIQLMKFKVLNGETHQELGKEIFNANNYDLTYGLENHLVVQALPADERDLAVREGVQVQLVGNVETWAYGTLMHNDEGVAETTLNFKPRGTGARVAYLAVVTQWSTDVMWDHWYRDSMMWYYNWMNLRVKPWYLDFTSPGEPVYWTYDNRGPDETLDYKCYSAYINLRIFGSVEGWVEALTEYITELVGIFEAGGFWYGELYDYGYTEELVPWAEGYWAALGGFWAMVEGIISTYTEFESEFLADMTLMPYQSVLGYLFSPYGHDIENQRKLTQIAPPVGFGAYDVPYFDAGKGLALTLKGDLVVGVETEVTVKVTEAGPNFPVAGAEVTLYGAGVDLAGVTDADGVAKFMVKPTEAGEILITASKDGYVPGKTVVVVGADTIAPELSVDKPTSPTNKPTVTITGIATDNAGVPMVMVNGVEATVGADGKFSAEVTLKEGENEILVVAKDKSGNKTEKMVKVVLDTIPPEVTVLPLAEPVTSTKVKLTGYVEAGAKVMVNDKPATVANDDWEVELTLDYGKNLVTIVATDAVGNEKKIETTVVVFKKTTLELQIGNPTPKVNGVYGDPLEAAPFIKDGRTMVPLRFIAEAFGAQVEWIPETKGINITLDLKSAVHTIGLQVGNPTAIVDGQVVTLDVAPVIVNGRTFVPLRFIAEAFGAKVDWNSLYQVVSIEFLWY